MSIQIICMGCGERGHIDYLAPEILHACGSKNVDLWFGTPEQVKVASKRAEPEPTFADFLGQRTAAQPPMPRPSGSHDDDFPVGDEPVAGWNEYTGPPPSENPVATSPHTETHGRAPTRPVPGQINQTNDYVYDKHDPYPPYGANEPAPLVAEHGYPSHVTKTPFLGQRRTTLAANCPKCFAAETSLESDHREHAHWYCQSKCGSLVNLDKHPEVDPFRPDLAFGMSRGWGRDAFRRTKKVFAGKQDGQIFRRMATITERNPGLSLSEVVHLARQSVIQYPEA